MAPDALAFDVVTYFEEFPVRMVVFVHIVVLRRRCMFASAGDAQTPQLYNALLVHHVPVGQADLRPVRALDVVIYLTRRAGISKSNCCGAKGNFAPK